MSCGLPTVVVTRLVGDLQPVAKPQILLVKTVFLLMLGLVPGMALSFLCGGWDLDHLVQRWVLVVSNEYFLLQSGCGALFLAKSSELALSTRSSCGGCHRLHP